MIRDWVYSVRHAPVCQILLQILCKTLITVSTPVRSAIPGYYVFLEILPSLAISQLLRPLSARLGYCQYWFLMEHSALLGRLRLRGYKALHNILFTLLEYPRLR